jgi:Chromo (CHRromatin Organisation MOdifier) domain
MDEFYVESIVEHKGKGDNPKRWTYRVRWLGYEESDETWLPYSWVENLAVLDEYAAAQKIAIPE